MTVEALTAQVVDRIGAQANLQSITAVDGFTFPNNGRALLYVENDAGALVLSFTIQLTVDGKAVTAKAITVTASENWVMGPFPPNIYNDADGLVTVTPDADLASAVAVIQLP
ncbi:MAG: hypothetical protein V3S69_07000 [Dehalococcoidales bacterium]